MTGTFVETDCKFEHGGRMFEAGGAFLADCSDGFRRGVVYAKPADVQGISDRLGRRFNRATYGIVTDWHGNKLADAEFGEEYQGNFCKMRAVSFTIDGVKYAGRYCPDWADMIRVRSTRKVS